jgi:hypothetical protein
MRMPSRKGFAMTDVSAMKIDVLSGPEFRVRRDDDYDADVV